MVELHRTPLLKSGEIDYQNIEDPLQREKVIDIIKILMDEIRLEYPEEAKFSREYSSKLLQRLQIFTNPRDLNEFTRKHRINIKNTNRFLYSGGSMLITSYLTGEQIPIVSLNKKEDSTFLHEINHTAEQIVGWNYTTESSRRISALRRHKLTYMIFAISSAASIILPKGETANRLEIVGIFFGLWCAKEYFGYQKLPSEIRADDTAKRIEKK